LLIILAVGAAVKLSCALAEKAPRETNNNITNLFIIEKL
jgi:hypothetical protein